MVAEPSWGPVYYRVHDAHTRDKEEPIMKAWTLTATAAALAALAACTDDAPDVAAAPDVVPGDPAVYAPDGWPLQIGDPVPDDYPRGPVWRDFVRYRGINGMHLVGDRVYGARFREMRPGPNIYEGHFPTKARWGPKRDRAESEHRWLPERFRGKIEYEPPPQYVGFDENGEPYLIPELLSPMHARMEEERRKREEERRKR